MMQDLLCPKCGGSLRKQVVPPLLFQCRIQSVEHVCRELFAQHRTVGNNACVVVDEGHTVNPSHGIYAEHDIDTVRFQQLPKLFPCIVRAHGVFDCLPQPVECPVLLQRALRPLIILLKGLIADILSDTARFERRADTVAIVGHGTVNHSGIVPSVDGSRAFLDRDIEQFQ